MSQAILIIDHGSRRASSNDMLPKLASLLQTHLRAKGDTRTVAYAHMELCEPTIAMSIDSLAAQGITDLVAMPYMLAPGRHATEDIPKLVAEACARHPSMRVKVAQCIGLHPLMFDVIVERVDEVQCL